MWLRAAIVCTAALHDSAAALVCSNASVPTKPRAAMRLYFASALCQASGSKTLESTSTQALFATEGIELEVSVRIALTGSVEVRKNSKRIPASL